MPMNETRLTTNVLSSIHARALIILKLKSRNIKS